MSLSVQLRPINIDLNLIPPGVDMKRVIENTLHGRAKDVKIDFDVTTQTWSKRPEFHIMKKSYKEFHVYTGSDVYFWLNDGTKRHWVAPRKASALAFQGGYSAKSMVRAIASRAGGPHGSFGFSKGHYVDGIDARKWDEEIAKKWAELLPNIFERAILAELF